MTPEELKAFECKELEVARALIADQDSGGAGLHAQELVDEIIAGREKGLTCAGEMKPLSLWIHKMFANHHIERT
jgi:hypothetical protein